MAEATKEQTTRYSTPLIYVNGKGKKVNKTLYFELDPVEFMDWTVNNRFAANELQAGLVEIRDAAAEDKDRDLRPDEVTTLLNIIKVLVQLSAGRPDDDGEYFIKDPNWIYSYAYRGFRTFLLEKPNEMNEFLTSLLNNDVMEKFAETIAKANENADDQPAPAGVQKKGNNISDEELQRLYRERIQNNAGGAAPSAD
jgi:hypothetical protein